MHFSESVGAPGPTLPRICSRQRHRSNVPADSPQEYYRRTVSVPFLDHLFPNGGAIFLNPTEGLHGSFSCT